MDDVIKYGNTNDLVQDICGIIDSAQDHAYQTVNSTLVLRNWFIGKRIAEESLGGDDRATYGVAVINSLSKELIREW